MRDQAFCISPDSSYICWIDAYAVFVLDLLSMSRLDSFHLAELEGREIFGLAISRTMGVIAIGVIEKDDGSGLVIVVSIAERMKISTIVLKPSCVNPQKLFLRWKFACVVFENSVCLYNDKSLELEKRQDTYSNSSGCCDWSTADNQRVVMCCLGLQRGTVRMERYFPSKSSFVFGAHETNIVALCVSGNGLHVATASETGTLIRVHALGEDSPLLFEIRWGHSLLGGAKVRRLFITPAGSFLGIIDETRRCITVYKTPLSERENQGLLMDSAPSKMAKIVEGVLSFGSKSSPWFSVKLANGNAVAAFGLHPFTLLVGDTNRLQSYMYIFDGSQSNVVSCPKLLTSVAEKDTSEPSVPQHQDDWVLLSELDSLKMLMGDRTTANANGSSVTW